jgi:hypothetical protein
MVECMFGAPFRNWADASWDGEGAEVVESIVLVLLVVGVCLAITSAAGSRNGSGTGVVDGFPSVMTLSVSCRNGANFAWSGITIPTWRCVAEESDDLSAGGGRFSLNGLKVLRLIRRSAI